MKVRTVVILDLLVVFAAYFLFSKRIGVWLMLGQNLGFVVAVKIMDAIDREVEGQAEKRPRTKA